MAWAPVVDSNSDSDLQDVLAAVEFVDDAREDDSAHVIIPAEGVHGGPTDEAAGEALANADVQAKDRELQLVVPVPVASVFDGALTREQFTDTLRRMGCFHTSASCSFALAAALVLADDLMRARAKIPRLCDAQCPALQVRKRKPRSCW